MSALKPTCPSLNLSFPLHHPARNKCRPCIFHHCVASWQGTISIPLAYLDGFDLDFAQVRYLDLQKCCWLHHLEADFSVAELVVQTRQKFHLPSLLNEGTEINALYSGINIQLQFQSHRQHVHLIIWSSTLSWPGGLERLGTLADCSGVPKMFEAILWGFLDAAASSSYPPKRLLEPPPGGRKTLQKTQNCNTTTGYIYNLLPIVLTAFIVTYVMDNTASCHLILSWSRLMFNETSLAAVTTESEGDLRLNTENTNFVSTWSNNRRSCLLDYTLIGVRLKTYSRLNTNSLRYKGQRLHGNFQTLNFLRDDAHTQKKRSSPRETTSI